MVHTRDLQRQNCEDCESRPDGAVWHDLREARKGWLSHLHFNPDVMEAELSIRISLHAHHFELTALASPWAPSPHSSQRSSPIDFKQRNLPSWVSKAYLECLFCLFSFFSSTAWGRKNDIRKSVGFFWSFLISVCVFRRKKLSYKPIISNKNNRGEIVAKVDGFECV